MNIAIVPARKNSKGIKNKNMTILNGMPLIHYTLDAIYNCKIFDKVIVSSDDPSILKYTKENYKEYSALNRPYKYSKDNTTDYQLISYLIKKIDLFKFDNINYITYLRPTSPLRTDNLIKNCVEKILKNKESTGLRTVTKAEGIQHPYWMLKEKDGYLVNFTNKGGIVNYPYRQLLPACYMLNGCVDIIRVIKQKLMPNLYGNKCLLYDTSEESLVDIDVPNDLKIAEVKLKYERSNN